MLRFIFLSVNRFFRFSIQKKEAGASFIMWDVVILLDLHAFAANLEDVEFARGGGQEDVAAVGNRLAQQNTTEIVDAETKKPINR